MQLVSHCQEQLEHWVGGEEFSVTPEYSRDSEFSEGTARAVASTELLGVANAGEESEFNKEEALGN